MSEVPEGLYYTKEHEWLRVEGNTVTIGITDHAQNALTDIVYIELPETGMVVEDMGEFAVVESVKSASPIFAPLAGEITEVNEELDVIKSFLEQSVELLNFGGRLACISYHSLEDRLVKVFIREGNFTGKAESDLYGNRNLPFIKVGNLQIPSNEEIMDNNRARSGKLRIAERI